MNLFNRKPFVAAVAAVATLAFATLASGATLAPEQQAKVDAKLTELKALATAPEIVSAVKAQNATPSAEVTGMTEEKWKSLPMTDPFVRGLAKNEAANFLKSKKGEEIAEAFVSDADGRKVGLLAKTSSWSHKGKAKHDKPMAGQTWQGDVEVDESTGVQQVQVAVPVMDGDKVVGSLVVGLRISKL